MSEQTDIYRMLDANKNLFEKRTKLGIKMLPEVRSESSFAVDNEIQLYQENRVKKRAKQVKMLEDQRSRAWWRK